MNIKQLIKRSGLRRTEFAKKYDIPIATLNTWEYGNSNPPPYVMKLLERCVNEDAGILDKPEPDVDQLKVLCDRLIDLIRKYD